MYDCDCCGGSGVEYGETCLTCGGLGFLREHE
jgi:DnaJ-class molecular chaperone